MLTFGFGLDRDHISFFTQSCVAFCSGLTDRYEAMRACLNRCYQWRTQKFVMARVLVSHKECQRHGQSRGPGAWLPQKNFQKLP